MTIYLLKLVAALLAMFLLVPAVVLVSTQSLSQTWEATKGYAIVVGLIFVGPMLLGCMLAGIGSALGLIS